MESPFASLNSFTQNSTQWGLPDGATARLGKGNINELAYSPDGARLAVSGSIGTWLYDTSTHQEIALLREREGAVTSVAISPDGRALASGSEDGAIHLWNVVTGVHLRTLKLGEGMVESLAFSPNGRALASAHSWIRGSDAKDNAVCLWDVVTGALAETFRGTGSDSSLAFSLDGLTLASV